MLAITNASSGRGEYSSQKGWDGKLQTVMSPLVLFVIEAIAYPASYFGSNLYGFYG